MHVQPLTDIEHYGVYIALSVPFTDFACTGLQRKLVITDVGS